MSEKKDKTDDIINQIMNIIIKKTQNPYYQNKILTKVINPITRYIFNQYYYYFITLCIILIIIILMFIICLIILINICK